MSEIKSFKEFITEAKGKDGAYYVINLPSKEDNYKTSLASGPHKSYKEAKKAGDGDYGLNQKQVIGVLVGGKLKHVDASTGKARDKDISTNLGSKHSKMEKEMGLNEAKFGWDESFTDQGKWKKAVTGMWGNGIKFKEMGNGITQALDGRMVVGSFDNEHNSGQLLKR